MRRICLSNLIAGFALVGFLLTGNSSAGGKSEKSDSKVKATATATKLGADGKQTVTITLDVEKDWYIYADPVNSDEYEVNRTKVLFKAKEKVAATVIYPAGKTKMKYNIYQGKVVIPCQVNCARPAIRVRWKSTSRSTRAASSRRSVCRRRRSSS